MPHTVRNRFQDSSFGRAFIVTLFFVTLASGLFWLDFFRSYSAEVTVLVVAKSGEGRSSDIAGTMKELSQTLSFYNRVLVEDDFLDDDFLGYAPDVRKEKWQDLVSVKKQDASGVLIIRAKGDTPEKAKRIASQTAQTMFSVAGLYYDVKTDVDMRIVDGPFVSYNVENPLLYIGMCLFTSFSLTAFFFLFLRVAPGFFGRKSTRKPSLETYSTTEQLHPDESLTKRAYPEFSTGDFVPWIDPKKFVPEKQSALSFEDIASEKENMQHSAPLESVDEQSSTKKLSHAIAFHDRNLPVADEASLPFTFETAPEEKVSEENMGTTLQKEAVSIEPSEPTQEDYKRRLNELLAHIEK